MPQVSIYPSNAELPANLECQIRAFIRITWFDAYQYDLNAPVSPEEWHPTHVVMADQHAVIGYAGVVWQMVEHNGETYKCYGLSGVFTYPAFRKKGYGRQIVDAATDRIRQDPAADIALLFTDTSLEKFYAQAGWEAMNKTIIHIGKKDQPEHFDNFCMMMFLSDKGKQNRAQFEEKPFYFAEYGW